MILFPCTECGGKLRVKPDRAGKRVKCPKCSTIVVAPEIGDEQPRKPEKLEWFNPPGPSKKSEGVGLPGQANAEIALVQSTMTGEHDWTLQSDHHSVRLTSETKEMWQIPKEKICVTLLDGVFHRKRFSSVVLQCQIGDELVYLRSRQPRLKEENARYFASFPKNPAGSLGSNGSLMVIWPIALSVIWFLVGLPLFMLLTIVVAFIMCFFEESPRWEVIGIIVVFELGFTLLATILFRWGYVLLGHFRAAGIRGVETLPSRRRGDAIEACLDCDFCERLNALQPIFVMTAGFLAVAFFSLGFAILTAIRGWGIAIPIFGSLFALAGFLASASVIVSSLGIIIAAGRSLLPYLCNGRNFSEVRGPQSRLLVLEEFIAVIVLAPLLALGAAVAIVDQFEKSRKRHA